MGVAVRGKHFDDTVADLDDGHIEGTAAQIVYHNFLFFFIVKTVSQSRRGRLVDDTLHVQTRNLARILGRLSLGIVKVRRNRDNGFRHLLAKVILRVRFQFLQNHCGNLLRGILFVRDRAAPVRTHISLDGSDGVIRVGNRLTLRRLAHKPLSVLRESHDGRCGSRALRIRDDSGFAALHNCHAAVCSS